MRHNILHMRQACITQYDPGPFVSISTLAYEYPALYRVPEHAHGSGQVIYAIHGVMEISVGQSYWLLPPQLALWIPPRTTHKIRMPGPVSMRTLFLRPSVARRMPASCTVLYVRPLLRELIVETVQIDRLFINNRRHCALRDLLISELESASPVLTSVTVPQDGRALAVAQRILDDPAQGRSLPALCATAGVSVRTVERVFQREVGVSFESWRRQVRLMKAIELLAAGCSLKEVAYKVGYERSSTLVTIFRQMMGTTPKSWAASLNKPG